MRMREVMRFAKRVRTKQKNKSRRHQILRWKVRQSRSRQGLRGTRDQGPLPNTTGTKKASVRLLLWNKADKPTPTSVKDSTSLHQAPHVPHRIRIRDHGMGKHPSNLTIYRTESNLFPLQIRKTYPTRLVASQPLQIWQIVCQRRDSQSWKDLLIVREA